MAVNLVKKVSSPPGSGKFPKKTLSLTNEQGQMLSR